MSERFMHAPTVNYQFAYDPVTLGFVLVLFKIFGLNTFKIDHVNDTVKVSMRGGGLPEQLLATIIGNIRGAYGDVPEGVTMGSAGISDAGIQNLDNIGNKLFSD